MNAILNATTKLPQTHDVFHRNLQIRGRIKGQLSLMSEESNTPSPSEPPNMPCSEEVPDAEKCFQTGSHTRPLVDSLHRFSCAIVCAVVHPLRRRSVLNLTACLPSSQFSSSGIHSPPSPDDDDLLHQYHLDLAQQLRPSLSSNCNWLEEDDIQVVGRLPINAGGFADLWRGLLDTRQVAIKSYRRYLSFDLSRVFLVCFSRSRLITFPPLKLYP